MMGRPWPQLATKAVGIPATPASTEKPSADRNPLSSFADRSSRKLLDRLGRVDLLVIDEMGYVNLRPEQTNIFFRLMEERYRSKATIITTNLDYDEWYNFLGNNALCEALLSRLRHQCHTVRIDGPSLREPTG